MASRIRLPRASSRAYRQLRPQQEAQEAAAEGGGDPQQPAEAPPAPAAAAANPQLVETLQAVQAADGGSVLSGGGAWLGQLVAAAQAGQVSVAEATRQLRALCEAAITSNWRGGRRDAAQAASELLDEANAALLELEEGGDAGPAAAPPPRAQLAAELAGPPRLPAETFFLPADRVRECLTLNIDASILLGATQQRGGWPAGRKRRGEGGGGGGGTGKRRGRQFNPWTPELQLQLATVLRLALSGPAAAAPTEEEVAALSPALSKLSAHLRSSQAGEQLQAMGASLSSCVSMLQVGGFTDFEELLNECREEAHASVEAYLSVAAVDVRRGRLVAHAESFVHTLGAAIEGVLNQLRAEHKAARGGAESDSEGELGDEFYPASLPPSVLANKEPFKGGDWRKTPYIPRPYERLTEYAVVEPEMREHILRKLSTKKHGGCDGQHCRSRADLGLYRVEREGFDTSCSCLARNTECDERCACHGSAGCLNRSVSRRDTVKIGADVQEVDAWGMDCYVRRNIMDAVLESGAFGAWAPPDYKALQAADAVEYAAMRAASSAPGGTGASPAAATLPPPPTAAAAKQAAQQELKALAAAQGQQQQQQQQQQGPPGTPTVGQQAGGEGGERAALNSPPTPAQVAAERQAADWLERALLPAINRQGATGWDLLAAVDQVRKAAKAAGQEASLRAADAVAARIRDVGRNYFRLHPKGVGLVCRRGGGLPPLTFVEEYLGEIHTPWRWFEIQDAVKRITGDELPDFYNILLERPRDDPDGYDVLFVDAAAKGAFASRMSHSCTPNCQAIIMACGGRLTIALYTLRHVHEGEELTFDYSSVTESEREFREAICLCSTRACRGSYLFFTGGRAFQQVLASQHTFLHRQVIIARAGVEPLGEADWARIKRHGLGDSALGSEAAGDRAPAWLIKWAALTLEYMEEEEAHLKQDLLAHPQGIYTESSATVEAKGVVANRLQNVVITLDKVKWVLRQPGQPQGPCLRVLTDAEVVEHLWEGPRAIAHRLLRGCVAALAPAPLAKRFAAADDLREAVAKVGGELPQGLAAMAAHVLQPAADGAGARAKLSELYRQVRALDLASDGGLTATADLLLLYSSTLHWFTCERGYKGITAPPVPINLEDLTLDRAGGGSNGSGGAGEAGAGGGGAGSRPASRAGSGGDLSGAGGVAANGGSESDLAGHASALRKVYRPMYVWGQLSCWFKQTVNDPTASLSAERRGTVSLPDVESGFSGGRARYSAKDRADLADQLAKRPDAMWRTGTIWSFKNEAKVYGSPALDAVWCDMIKSGDNPLPAVVAELRGADVPPRMQLSGAGGGGKTRGGSKKKAAAAE